MNVDLSYQVMLPVLEMFHNATHSYGWSIVLMTVLVRVLVWPLVAQSTRSMQRMSQLQPQMKILQERYKEDPTMLQQKTMEFYQKNKVNPMGGCLPTLVQLPVLWALYATFMGPPFGDKVIDVKVNVVPPAQVKQVEQKETSGNNSPYIGSDGKMAKVTVFPGEATVVQGSTVDYGLRAIAGDLPPGFKVDWRVFPKNTRDINAVPSEEGDSYHVKFGDVGEWHVQAKVMGVAKNDHFGFISGLGKSAKGIELLAPANFDLLVLIVLFGLTMYFSQKFTVSAPKVPDSEMDDQQKIQRDTMKTMPIAMTAMFFFIPLPTGVYLYMVISNFVQTLQTWLIQKGPVEPLVDVTGDGTFTMSPGKGDNTYRVDGDQSSNGDGRDTEGARAGKKKKKRKK